jgi:hypothetical protein
MTSTLLLLLAFLPWTAGSNFLLRMVEAQAPVGNGSSLDSANNDAGIGHCL